MMHASLVKAGWRVLGSGGFAYVFGHVRHPDLAIKLGSVDEWRAFVMWGMQHGYAGRFTPRIHAIKSFERCFLAVMERLHHTAYEATEEQSTLYLAMKRTIEWSANPSTWLRDNHPDLYGFAIHCNRDAWRGDVWEKNVMFRRDGSIVLTDPQYTGEDSALKTKYRHASYRYSPKRGDMSRPFVPKPKEPISPPMYPPPPPVFRVTHNMADQLKIQVDKWNAMWRGAFKQAQHITPEQPKLYPRKGDPRNIPKMPMHFVEANRLNWKEK